MRPEIPYAKAAPLLTGFDRSARWSKSDDVGNIRKASQESLWLVSCPTNQGVKRMLVLSRKLGAEIVIDGGIRVVVLSVHRERVRLGISAPRSVSVDRSEVAERRAMWSELNYAGDAIGESQG